MAIAIILFFLAYIVVGSLVTVLATYVSDFVDPVYVGDPMMLLLVMVWPLSSLPLLIYASIRKLCDSIFKD